MIKASDVKGFMVTECEMETASDALFRQGYKELYLERENLNKVIKNWIPHSHDKLIDEIVQSFNAGHLLRVKE